MVFPSTFVGASRPVACCALFSVVAMSQAAPVGDPVAVTVARLADGPTVDGTTISWPDDGWYQVQDAITYESLCQGGTSCTVEAGTYIVINHTTGRRYEDVVVESGDGSVSAAAVTIDGNTIRWPDDGWYQVQNATTYESLCEGGTACMVEPGSYTVINLTTGERFTGIEVAGEGSRGISVDGNTIHWPDDGWYQVQNAETYESLCEGGTSCAVESGTYFVINLTNGTRNTVTVPESSDYATLSSPDALFSLLSGSEIVVAKYFASRMFVDGYPIGTDNADGFAFQEQFPPEGQPDQVLYTCEGGGRYAKPGVQYQWYTLHDFQDCVIDGLTFNGGLEFYNSTVSYVDFRVDRGDEPIFRASGSVGMSTTKSGNYTAKYWSFKDYYSRDTGVEMLDSHVQEIYDFDYTAGQPSLEMVLRLRVRAPWTGEAGWMETMNPPTSTNTSTRALSTMALPSIPTSRAAFRQRWAITRWSVSLLTTVIRSHLTGRSTGRCQQSVRQSIGGQ